jgi:hypothetical protein
MRIEFGDTVLPSHIGTVTELDPGSFPDGHFIVKKRRPTALLKRRYPITTTRVVTIQKIWAA